MLFFFQKLQALLFSEQTLHNLQDVFSVHFFRIYEPFANGREKIEKNHTIFSILF